MRTLVGLLLLAIVAFAEENDGTNWAVLVAGSRGWGNYRHQADICHAYHILEDHGIPKDNIVVMMVDDIAGYSANPYPGKIFNKPDGPDVYAGVPKHYTGRDVTPENFIKVLLGENGSKKTIKSGPNDNVFVYFADHGATGLIAFPYSRLYSKTLNDALNKMHSEKKFKKLVFYLEACESGSMFRNILAKDIAVYAFTAADYNESSWGAYCYNPQRLPCLGDTFSISWLEDSDKADLTQETLAQQHTVVKERTTKSRVQQYGDLTFQSDKLSVYQGSKKASSVSEAKASLQITGQVNARDIPLVQMQQQLNASTPLERESLLREIAIFQQKRLYVDTVVQQIADRVVPIGKRPAVMSEYPSELTQFDCHYMAVETFSRRCFSLSENEYALKYSRVLANLCEVTADTFKVLDGIYEVCSMLENKPENVQ